MKKLVKYLKCVWYNKAVLFGYLFLPIGLWTCFSDSGFLYYVVSPMCGILSGYLLTVCMGGYQTMNTYDRLVEIHKAGKSTDFHYYHYCDRVAYQWFLKEKKFINQNQKS